MITKPLRMMKASLSLACKLSLLDTQITIPGDEIKRKKTPLMISLHGQTRQKISDWEQEIIDIKNNKL